MLKELKKRQKLQKDAFNDTVQLYNLNKNSEKQNNSICISNQENQHLESIQKRVQMSNQIIDYFENKRFTELQINKKRMSVFEVNKVKQITNKFISNISKIDKEIVIQKGFQKQKLEVIKKLNDETDKKTILLIKKQDIKQHLNKSYNFSNIINNELNKFVEKERKQIAIRSQREKPNQFKHTRHNL